MNSNYRYKRVFLIVMDSVGVGHMEDAHKYGDEGANTLQHILNVRKYLNVPTLNSLGLGDFVTGEGVEQITHPNSYTITLKEQSNGKDTMTGHWEMMGVYTITPFQTFTDTGFPQSLIEELEEKTGHKIIGNYASSGTEILKVLGEEQKRDNSLIVYTSSDSVLQIAAHEETTPLSELYRCCDIAREICMKPEYFVGRIIARPFLGNNKDDFYRVTGDRHDIAVSPSHNTAMDELLNNNLDTIAIGKIFDIFNGKGVKEKIKTVSNIDGMNKTIEVAKNNDFIGLCFVNLVEFDSEFGHRRDVEGYAKCIEIFDTQLKDLINELKDDDLLLITADHGNDPTWIGTDHTREKVPLIAYSKSINKGKYLGEKDSFADIGLTIINNFNINKNERMIGKPINEIIYEN